MQRPPFDFDVVVRRANFKRAVLDAGPVGCCVLHEKQPAFFSALKLARRQTGRYLPKLNMKMKSQKLKKLNEYR